MFGVDPAFMNVLDINTPAAQSKYGWIDTWQCYANLTVFHLISRRLLGDHKRLCTVESGLRLERFPPTISLEPGTARSASECLTY